MTAERENRHGVAVAVGDIGVLVVGESGSGKSSLAARLISHWPHGIVRLVADDRVLLERCNGRVLARAHSAIEGALEVRGYGIVRPAVMETVVIRGILKLSKMPTNRLPDAVELEETLLGLHLPCATLPQGEAAFSRLITIWPYFRGQIVTDRSILDHRP
jgi:serine kinase of HPr protein (carbohydrate metabolism regulator)